MYHITKMNKIANVVNDYFPEDKFALDDSDNPDGILVRSANMFGYEKGKALLAVARAGAGTNNIPCADYAQEGIVVFNTPGANANAVKELVLTAIFLASRKIVDGIEWAKTLKGEEDVPGLVEKGKSRFAGQEIKGKKLGVIGLGAIGAMVANDALRLGMQVTGYDPYINVEHAWQLSHSIKRETNLEKLVAQSDYITVHVPLTPDTKAMFNKQLLHKMKRGAALLNFSRGGLVDDDALITALSMGRVGCYITDFPDEKILGVPGVIAIPHLGASTAESEDNCAHMAAAQLAEYLLNGNIKNSVNYPEAILPRTTAHRITIMHKNITNMVGQMTAVLAEGKHNIADMINKSRGEIAYTIIDTDHDVTEEEIAKLMGIGGVIRVRSLGRVE